MSEIRLDSSTARSRGARGRAGGLRGAAACVAAAIGCAGLAGPAGAGVNAWTAAGPNGGQVVAMAPDPVDPRVIYAATGYGGIFKSSDGGASWQAASRGLTDHQMIALAVDPRHPRTLYASSHAGGVSVSHDGAATWAPTAPLAPFPGESDYATSLAVDPAHAGTVYAADPDAGVWVSRDGGGSWTLPLQSRFGALGIARLATDPVRSSVFVFTFDTNEYTLFETADGGLTWTDHSASLPGLPFGYVDADFAVEAAAPGTLYIGWTRTEADTGRLIRKTFRSADGGATWRGAGTGGFPLAAAGGLVISGGLKSADHGVTWRRAAAPPEPVEDYAISADGARIYAGAGIQGVFASSDGGHSWQVANQGLAATPVLALAVDPQTPGTWYAAPFGRGLLKSGTSGRHWRPLGVSDLSHPSYCCPPSYGAMVVVDPAAPATVFYAVDRLRKSTDGGASWTVGAPSWFVRSLIPDPSSPAVVYAIGASDSCPYPMFSTFGRSADGGATFTCLELNPYEAVVAPSAPATLYALVVNDPPDHVLFKSTNSGASWTPIDAGLPLASELSGPLFALGHLAVDPTDADRLYVSGPSGVWVTPDGGGQWIQTSRRLPRAVQSALLAIDPGDPSVLYAADGSFGVYRSRDGGRHWQPILAGLPPVGVEGYTALVADPTRPGSLYLATLGNGVLSYSSQ